MESDMLFYVGVIAFVWIYLVGLVAVVLWQKSMFSDEPENTNLIWVMRLSWPISLPVAFVAAVIAVAVLAPLRKFLIERYAPQAGAWREAGQPLPERLRVIKWIVRRLPS